MAKVCVGIDVSKARLDVHVLPQGEAFAVPRDGEGLNALADRLMAVSPDVVAVEATGGFEQVVAAALVGVGLPLVVVNPAQVRHFAKALGQRAKSDPIDAGVIAPFAQATQPVVRPCRTRPRGCRLIWWRGVGRSWRRSRPSGTGRTARRSRASPAASPG